MKLLLVQLAITFSLLNIASCNHQQVPLQSTINGSGVASDDQLHSVVLSDTIPSYSWKVEGCATEKDQKANTKNKQIDDIASADDPLINVKGDSIIYTRSLTHLCCRQVRVSTYQKDTLLTIKEYWHNQGCKCHCNSTVSAVLKKIAKGNYRLCIIEAGTNPFDDKPMLSQDTIWSQPVIIK